MADQKEFKKRLKVLMSKPENQVCSDCPERQPRWASLIVPPPGAPPGSIPMGAFCCLECSGSHRRLGVHISFVRSINLDSWKEKEVLAMENGGNHKVNTIFEAKMPRGYDKPSNHADGPTRERFIRDKYERRKFYDADAFLNYSTQPLVAAPPPAAPPPPPPSLSANMIREPMKGGPTPVVSAPLSDVARQRLEERRGRLKKNTSASSSGGSTSEEDLESFNPPRRSRSRDLIDMAATTPTTNTVTATPSRNGPRRTVSRDLIDLAVGGGDENNQNSTQTASSNNNNRTARSPPRRSNSKDGSRAAPGRRGVSRRKSNDGPTRRGKSVDLIDMDGGGGAGGHKSTGQLDLFDFLTADDEQPQLEEIIQTPQHRGSAGGGRQPSRLQHSSSLPPDTTGSRNNNINNNSNTSTTAADILSLYNNAPQNTTGIQDFSQNYMVSPQRRTSKMNGTMMMNNNQMAGMMQNMSLVSPNLMSTGPPMVAVPPTMQQTPQQLQYQQQQQMMMMQQQQQQMMMMQQQQQQQRMMMMMQQQPPAQPMMMPGYGGVGAPGMVGMNPMMGSGQMPMNMGAMANSGGGTSRVNKNSGSNNNKGVSQDDPFAQFGSNVFRS